MTTTQNLVTYISFELWSCAPVRLGAVVEDDTLLRAHSELVGRLREDQLLEHLTVDELQFDVGALVPVLE